MKAVAPARCLPIDDPRSLVDVEPKPVRAAHELRVRVEAVPVDPVATRLCAPKPQLEAQPRALGFDAAGMAEAINASEPALSESVAGIGRDHRQTIEVFVDSGPEKQPMPP